MALRALIEPALLESDDILSGALFDEDDRPITPDQLRRAVKEWQGPILDALDFEAHEIAVSWHEWLELPAVFKDVIGVVKQFRKEARQ